MAKKMRALIMSFKKVVSFYRSLSSFLSSQSVLLKKKVRDFFISYGMLGLIFFSGLCIFFSCTLYKIFVPTDTLTVTFLDVGQGDGIFIESPTKTKVLIDGGPSGKVVSLLSSRLSFFDRQIDFVAPSHADKDHITGSISALMNFPVINVAKLHASTTTELDDEYDKQKMGKEIRRSNAGDTVDIGGGAKLTMLYPKEGQTFSEKETNDSSSVILLTYGEFSFLFTGDLPETREHELITSGLLPHNLTVLKLGHHGSKYSSGTELLSYTKPKFAIVSAGKDNKYGHPSAETLERVAKVGSIVLSTIEKGDITFQIKLDSLEVVTSK